MLQGKGDKHQLHADLILSPNFSLKTCFKNSAKNKTKQQQQEAISNFTWK